MNAKYLVGGLFGVTVLAAVYFGVSGAGLQGNIGRGAGSGGVASSYSSCSQTGPVLYATFSNLGNTVSGQWVDIKNGSPKDVLQSVIDGCELRVVLDGPNTLAFNCSYVAVAQKDGKQNLYCTNSGGDFGFSSVGGKKIGQDVVHLGLNTEGNKTWLGVNGGSESYILADFNKALFYVN